MHFAHDNFPVNINFTPCLYITVNAKVHGLKEIFNRLDRRTYPLPTGNDVANYLKWFQQTLQRYRRNSPLGYTITTNFPERSRSIPNLIYTDPISWSPIWVSKSPRYEGCRAYCEEIISPILAHLR